MKLKDRIKTYNFWVSLSSAIFLIIKVLGSQIGFKVDENLFSDLITSLCSILVLLGIIVPPTKIQSKSVNLNNETLSKNCNDDLCNTNSLMGSNNLCESNIETNIESNVENKTTPNTENSSTKFVDETENTNRESLCNESTNETNQEPNNDNDLEVYDVSLDSADVFIENIDSLSTLKNDSLENLKTDIQSQFDFNKKLFAENMCEYIKLLETELESIKNK